MCFFLLLVKVMRNQYSPVKCQASFCLSQIIITSPSCQDSYNNNNNNERATVIISLWWIIKLFKHYTQHLPLKIQLWKSTQSRPASGRARTHHRNALQPSRSARGGGSTARLTDGFCTVRLNTPWYSDSQRGGDLFSILRESKLKWQTSAFFKIHDLRDWAQSFASLPSSPSVHHRGGARKEEFSMWSEPLSRAHNTRLSLLFIKQSLMSFSSPV